MGGLRWTRGSVAKLVARLVRRDWVVARLLPSACCDTSTSVIARKNGKIVWHQKRQTPKLSFRNVLDRGEDIWAFLNRQILFLIAHLVPRPMPSEAEGCQFG